VGGGGVTKNGTDADEAYRMATMEYHVLEKDKECCVRSLSRDRPWRRGPRGRCTEACRTPGGQGSFRCTPGAQLPGG